MIYFFADDHYNVHPGQVIYENLPPEWQNRIRFFENDITLLEEGSFVEDGELLILHMIGSSCGRPHPGEGAKRAVRSWVGAGKPILLLHGASAAFWQWNFWRILPGYRWIRGEDPDGVTPSTHPRRPYKVTLSKTRHELCRVLEEMDLPEDELYIELEQVCPAMTLMETKTEEGTFPQCAEVVTPFGGKIMSFIPGHDPQVTSNPVLIRNVVRLIEYLLR